jgi:hypothetical protein
MNIIEEINENMIYCINIKDRLGYIRLKAILMKLESGEYTEKQVQELLLKYF